MVNSQSMPILDRVTWEYVVLHSIELRRGAGGLTVRLICQDDAGGWTYAVHCDECRILYLDPYAQLLLASRTDLSVETPQVPVYRDSNGRLHLDLRGAEADYPYLRLERKFSLSDPGSLKRLREATPALAHFLK